MNTITAADSEAALLGAALIEPEVLLTADDLEAQHFADPRHRTIFGALWMLYQDRDEIDLVTLCEHLRAGGRIAAAGGPAYIASLTESAVPSLAAKYAEAIRDAALRRRAQGEIGEILRKIPDYERTRDLAVDVERVAIEIGEEARERADPSAAAILADLRRAWEAAREMGGALGVRLPPGRLEQCVPSLDPGHLWVVGGYTSVGKSTFAASLISDALADGARCVVFSLEDLRQDKLTKILSARTGISASVLKSGFFTDAQRCLIDSASADLSVAPLLVYDDVSRLDEMRVKLRRAKLRLGGVDVVVIDFVQNISGERGEGIYERMSRAAVVLQKLAKDIGVCVVALSQVNNEAMRQGPEIEVIGLKGAGELAAAADVILWLQRSKRQMRELTVKLIKNRPWGPTGDIAMRFSDTWSRVEEG